MTDPIADMLTRIRNACQAGHRRVDMPVLDDGRHGLLRLYLKYDGERAVIHEVQRVSKPGLRRYVKAREVPRVKNGLGMAIVSTPRGLMSDRDARRARMGGELVAVLW
jgi:small subunit ribosomal protein S8